MIQRIDVIDYVRDHSMLLKEILQWRNRFAFISTPNWRIKKCAHPYHITEYTPHELRLVSPTGSLTFHQGNWDGSLVRPVRHLNTNEPSDSLPGC